MKHQQVTRNHQQSKNDTPLVRGILQRAAVRSPNEESSHYSESRFHQDFSQLPVTSSGDLGVASSRVPIQAKMIVGQVNDRYEQEADRIAVAAVQQIHAPGVATGDGQAVQRRVEEDELRMKPITYLQREAMEEDDELQLKPMIQRVGTEGGEVSADFESEINLARGGGQPLAPELQMQMGLAMGADFSGVKVHTDGRADGLNRTIGARAFTIGQDLFFQRGEYQPGSRGGQELIAHELTHVVQQNGGSSQRATESCELHEFSFNNGNSRLVSKNPTVQVQLIQRQIMPVNELTGVGTSEARYFLPMRKFRALILKVTAYHNEQDEVNKRTLLEEILVLCKAWKDKNIGKDKPEKHSVVEKLQEQVTDELRNTASDPELKDVRGKEQTYTPEYTLVDKPLFEPGQPAKEDVKQGYLGDCCLLATLSSLAATDPRSITDMMRDGGTTVTVRFYKGGNPEYIKVNKSIPNVRKVNERGEITLIDPYGQGVLWVQMIEKAFAVSRGGYAKTEGGTGVEALEILTGESPSVVTNGNINMPKLLERQKQQPWPYALPGSWMYKEVYVEEEIKFKQAMYPKIFGQYAEAWKTFVEQKEHRDALDLKHTLEAFADYFQQQGLANELAQLALEYLENAKLYPGKLGTGKYSQEQLAIFNKVTQALQERRRVVAGTKATVGPGSPIQRGHSGNEPKVKGLVGGHEYTVLGAEDRDGIKFIKLRNPWGHYGRDYIIFDEETSEMTPRIAGSMDLFADDDTGGEFWIELSDLSDNFNELVYA